MSALNSLKEETQPKKGNNYFLGIGIDQYTNWDVLHNAVKDVKDICQVLQEEYEFPSEYCFTLFDEKATEDNILKEIESLVDTLKKHDNLLIYYSGHGHLHRQTKEGFWVPINARLDAPGDFISNQQILKYVSIMKARHVLIFSDSCFSGTLFRTGGFRSGQSTAEQLFKMKSRWGLCSGRHDELVYDGEPGKNSPFSESIIKILRENPEPSLNIMKFVDQVIKTTRTFYDGQMPEGQALINCGHKGGQFIFNRKKIEKDEWEKAEKINTVSSYQQFLAVYPNGKYAPVAKERIELLSDQGAWQSALSKNTPRAFNQYLLQFRAGKYREQAHQKIYELEDDKMYAKVKSSGLLHLMYKYLRNFPRGKHVDEINGLIKFYRSASIKIGSSDEHTPWTYKIKGGVFDMGSNVFQRESPIHTVRVSNYSIGVYPVTFKQYDAYCEQCGIEKPSDEGWGRDERPVINVSWYDALKYCNWLSKKNSLELFYLFEGDQFGGCNFSSAGFRLPTEAEWEYAARGGEKIKEPKQIYAGGASLDQLGWYLENAGGMTHPVGKKLPNELGVYDMCGNVYEWCFDYWQRYYYQQLANKTSKNPIGPDAGVYRSVRGGSFRSKREYCRIFYRENGDPGKRKKYIGLRVAKKA